MTPKNISGANSGDDILETAIDKHSSKKLYPVFQGMG